MSSADRRRMVEERQRETAKKALAKMKDMVATGGADEVQSAVKRLAEQFKDSSLAMDERRQMMGDALQIELDACCRKVDLLLTGAIDAARQGNADLKIDRVRRAQDYHRRAVTLGAGKEFVEHVKELIDIIRDTVPAGTSEKARNQVVTWDVDPGAKHAGKERRKYHRLDSPKLNVVIGANTYKSIDWSMTSVRIEGAPSGLHEGGKALLMITVEEEEKPVPVRGEAKVVWISEAATAFEFHLGASPILTLTRERRLKF